jgi:hypothetical protein
VIFKVPNELPKGQHWAIGITDGLQSPQSCATIDQASFRTRGVKGAILVATFRPEQDGLDTNPTAWCSGSQGGSTWLVIAFSATRRGKPVRGFAGRHFTIM